MLFRYLFIVTLLNLSHIYIWANTLDLNPKGNGNGTGEGDFVVRVTFCSDDSVYYNLFSNHIDDESRYKVALEFIDDLKNSQVINWCIVGTGDCL